MGNIKILARFNLKSSIISINKAPDSVLILSQDYQACQITLNDMRLRKQTKLFSAKKLPHKYAKCASANANFFAHCEAGNNVITIAQNAESIKPVLLLKAHKSDISATSFSQDLKLFASGGEDGRTYLYSAINFKRFLSLPYRPDYVSFLQFSSDSRFLFASCFNKSNIIFDCQRAKVISIFNTAENVDCAGFFANNSKIFIIMRNLQSLIFSIKDNKIIGTQSQFSAWPSAFSLDSKYAVIGARNGSIYLVDLENNVKKFSVEMENFAGISSICVHLGYIIVGGINGDIAILGFEDENNAFENALKRKDYKLAATLLDENIFLSLKDCARIFDEDWEGILKQAIELLGENRIDEALELTAPFTRDESKKEALNVYLNKNSTLKQFGELVQNRFYEEAYNLAFSNKFLNKTSHFDELESLWNRAFLHAKKLLEDGNIDAAKRALEPFSKTPKKDLINYLFGNLGVFKEADNFIKEQNFKDYFSLCAQFSYLKDGELYKKVNQIGENLFEKALNAKAQKHYDEFYKLAEFLANFPDFKTAITDSVICVDKSIEFLDLIKQNRITEAYKIAEEFDELQYLDEFKSLIEQFEEIYSAALEIAFSGKPSALEGAFGSYLKINYWSDKIKNAYNIAYLEEFRQNKANTAINWNQSIKNYIQIFGKDDDISDFCAEINLEFEADVVKMPFNFQKTLLSKAL